MPWYRRNEDLFATSIILFDRQHLHVLQEELPQRSCSYAIYHAQRCLETTMIRSGFVALVRDVAT